jgi:hypothetical protein
MLVSPHDLPWGAKTWDAINAAIRLRDKLLLILSKASIASEWVEDEVIGHPVNLDPSLDPNTPLQGEPKHHERGSHLPL